MTKNWQQKKGKEALAALITLALLTGSVSVAAAEGDTVEPVSVEATTDAAATTETTGATDAATDDAILHDEGETVVYATRIADSTEKTPANVTVITARQLEKRNVSSLREALQQEESIYVSPTADTKGGVSLRGFSGPDILVLYDGIPLNTAFDGNIEWDNIPVSDIERIEILRGAASSLYGGHAVGGVINIISKNPRKGYDGKIHGSVFASYGTYGTWRRGLSLNGGEGRFSFRLGYVKNTTDGWPGYRATASSSRPKATEPTTAYGDLEAAQNGRPVIGGRGAKSKDRENISLTFRYDFTRDQSLRYSYMHSEYSYRYNNPFTYLRDAAGNPTFEGVFAYGNRRYKASYSNYLGYNGFSGREIHRLAYEDTKNQWKVGFGYSNHYKAGYSSARSPKSLDWNGSGARASYPGRTVNADLQKIWKLGSHTLLAGAAWERDKMEYTNSPLSHWLDESSVSGPSTNTSKGTIVSTALFLQDNIALSPKWDLQAGLRYDRFEKKDGMVQLEGEDARTFPSESFTSWNPKIALSYHPDDGTTLYASYGRSFNPPQIYKLYRRSGDDMSRDIQANPALEPETSDTFEIGLKRRASDKFSYNMAFFSVNTDDRITLDRENGIRAYYNKDSGYTKGFELGLKYRFDRAWSSYLNYTYQTAETTSDGVTEPDYDIPKHMLQAGVEWHRGPWRTLLDMRYVSERQDTEDISGVYGSEDAYFLTNLFINYKITRDLKAQFSIQNLFDREFYSSEVPYGRMYTFGLQYDF